MEKSKHFDEAIEAYKLGRRVIEDNYGQSHQQYQELLNCINGAKFRSKFIKKGKPGALEKKSLQVGERNLGRIVAEGKSLG